MFRLAFTSFQFPKKTPFPLRRGHDWNADIILGVSILAAVAVVSCLAAYLIRHFGHNAIIMVAIVISCGPYVLRLIVLFLGMVRLVHHRPVALSDQRPPLEVISPAFNEQINIVDLLESIDEAAEFYGGPVRAIICDDGSTDDTVALAEAAIARLRFATGEIVHGGHHGKSAALNRALSRGTADYVFRVDADCIVDRKAFAYAISYFLSDPQIGMVGAFTLPREPYTTWIDRARLFELVVNFGLVRPATDVVDGVVCVPGTFTGFRRAPAEEIGGFVDGMYGEDQDFTAAITRLGYRVQLDTRIRSFEDVPNTQRQLRAQRTRWNRGSTMSFTRYVPVVTGLSGPRFWFFGSRSTGQRLLTPLRLAIMMYIIAESLIQPSGKINLAHLAIILTLRVLPQMVFVVACCIYYGKVRDLIWLPVELPFAMLKHYYSLESLLSFNARPVITAQPGRGDPSGGEASADRAGGRARRSGLSGRSPAERRLSPARWPKQSMVSGHNRLRCLATSQGAGGGNRTHDLTITSRLRYQLRHTGRLRGRGDSRTTHLTGPSPGGGDEGREGHNR